MPTTDSNSGSARLARFDPTTTSERPDHSARATEAAVSASAYSVVPCSLATRRSCRVSCVGSSRRSAAASPGTPSAAVSATGADGSSPRMTSCQ